MATLTPVDNDPFAAPAPVKGNLTPVDHDPFTAPQTAPQDQTPFFFAKDAQHPSKVGEWLKTAIDSGTFGLADTAQGGLNALGAGDSDKSIAQLRADTQAGRADIGPWGSASADIAGYLVGPGKFGLGARVAEGLGARTAGWLGRRLAGAAGGAVEGGVASGAGSLGHGEDLATAGNKALEGGVAGGLLSGVVGGVAQKGTSPASVGENLLEANSQGVRNEMTKVKYDAGDVDAAYKKSVLSLSPDQRANVSYGMRQDIIRQRAEAARAGDVTADTINGFSRNVFDGARTDGDNVLAARIRDNLHKDVLGSALPTSQHPVGYGSMLNSQANEATARLKDSQWLSGTDVLKAPAEAQRRLDNPAMLYSPEDKQALSNLANFAPKSAASQAPMGGVSGAWQGAKNTATGLATDKLVPGAVGWALHGLTGGLTGLATQLGVGGLMGAGKGIRNAEIQRAMDAARSTLTSGKFVHPNEYLPPAWKRDILRGALYSGGSSDSLN